MGYDYALVHLKYTIPPAIALSLLYRSLVTRLDVYKILFLITIAVVSTTPWDSYLIRTRIWTYPPSAIIGPTFLSIPAEELFFFVIQTYNTSVLYLLCSKPTFHPVFLKGARLSTRDTGLVRDWSRACRFLGQMALLMGIKAGARMTNDGGEGVYMGLIMVWAGPFIFLLWSLAYQFILGLPLSNTLIPIALPTLYLWIVDTLALKRGTWVIEPGTKLGIHLWEGLEIEEAVFFLATNTLIVFGLIAFDNAIAVLHTFADRFPTVPTLPSPLLLIRALLLPSVHYDEDKIMGLTQALARLKKKSRSFYLASAVFQGRLRTDLILLYSFCRVADDLVDDTATPAEARGWIRRLTQYLDLNYKASDVTTNQSHVQDFIRTEFPPATQSALLLLPTSYLSSPPLYGLLEGFKMDLQFVSNSDELKADVWPISSQQDLQTYAERVAGTVAELCLQLVYHHTTTQVTDTQRQKCVHAGGRMGVALQYVNISRDIAVDAKIGRVYIPTTWLTEEGLSHEDVLKDPDSKQVEALRNKLLDEAGKIYDGAKGAIEELPGEARAPMRVAVESYMEIGRVLAEGAYRVKAGRATVPKTRRLRVAWRALAKG
ncbi:MAG: hypothetical protein M1827_007416 [Pycnora praestabilis]|nr:MAG: hypothetical protein M1827_007416 [Pycnora praestabilis]